MKALWHCPMTKRIVCLFLGGTFKEIPELVILQNKKNGFMALILSVLDAKDIEKANEIPTDITLAVYGKNPKLNRPSVEIQSKSTRMERALFALKNVVIMAKNDFLEGCKNPLNWLLVASGLPRPTRADLSSYFMDMEKKVSPTSTTRLRFSTHPIVPLGVVMALSSLSGACASTVVQ